MSEHDDDEIADLAKRVDWSRFGLVDAVCDHCGCRLHRDTSGWWVDTDGTSDCGTSPRGHEIDGQPR